MKRVFHIILLCLTVAAWLGFASSGREVKQLEGELAALHKVGDLNDEGPALEDKITGARSERIMLGLLLVLMTAGIAGVFISVYLLPFFAQKLTHAIYDSGELVEKDKMREAHSLLAQGEYELAVEAFKKVADNDPMNRLPWVEISKVYRNNLHDPAAAIETLREAIESHEWQIDDAAFLLFRLAEIYNEDMEDRMTARSIMQQVVENFPESRHSANANHKLRDWDHEEASQLTVEEQEFIARQRNAEDGESGRQA